MRLPAEVVGSPEQLPMLVGARSSGASPRRRAALGLFPSAAGSTGGTSGPSAGAWRMWGGSSMARRRPKERRRMAVHYGACRRDGAKYYYMTVGPSHVCLCNFG
jgi:hypothetical protein